MAAAHPYYKFDRINSYNATINSIVGGRGLGKTYGCKVSAVRAFIKKGDQFIYLRRYKDELKKAKATFFADFAHLFGKFDFKVQGDEALIAPVETRDEKKRQWKTMGYFIALSTAQSQKSVSFPRVKTIIFDEFIIERGATHYLPDEWSVFLNLYSTVDRWTDKTKVWLLANSVSIMNPYFLALEIRAEQEWIVGPDGFYVVHFPDAEAFASSVYQTRFGKFIANTEYGEFAVGNQFPDNHDQLLETKDYKARYQFSLECAKGTFSVWHSAFADQYYVQAKRPKAETIFTLVAERMSEDKTYVTFNDRVLGFLRTAFRHGRVTFDNPTTRNTFTEIFKR